MQFKLLKSKIHRAEITDCNVDYEGSLGVDAEFMEKAGALPYEHVIVGNISNGKRFETYLIPEPAGSKAIVLNGAAAHLGKTGDLLVVMAFANLTPEEAQTFKPKIIVLGEYNRKIIKQTNT